MTILHKENQSQLTNPFDDLKGFVLSRMGTLKSLVVQNEETKNSVLGTYKEAKLIEKKLENTRLEMGEIYRSELSKINNKAKELSEPLAEITRLCNKKIADYEVVLKERALKAEEELRAQAALFDAQDDVYIPEIKVKISNECAGLQTRIVKKFRVIDISKVPSHYFMLDEDKISRDIRAGLGAIEGIEIYEEKTTSLVRR